MCRAERLTKKFLKEWKPRKNRTGMKVEEQYHRYEVFCKITEPEKVAQFFSEYQWEKQEHFLAIFIDSANHIINFEEITTGLANQTPIHPREAFRSAIVNNAVSVIFAHNHPSGNTEPSNDDWAITKVLCAAGKILKIPVLDHVIIGMGGLTSLCRRDPDLFEQTMNKA